MACWVSCVIMGCLAELTQSRQTPAGQRDQKANSRKGRSRSNTAHSYGDRYDEPEEPVPVRPSIRSNGRVASGSRLDTHQEQPDSPVSPVRPNWGRSPTFEGPTSIYRTTTPVNGRKPPLPTDAAQLRVQLRPANRINTGNTDVFGDPSDESTANSASPDHSYRDRSVSPATSQGSVASRTASYNNGATTGKKGPPPPPPSRAKKPPPPPPMKRADFSAPSVARY
jgi:hypothetical protein